MTDGEIFLNAIREGDLDRVQTMIVESPELLFVKDDNGISVVLTAAYYRQSKVIELLLAQDMKLDIWEAAAVGRIERVAELIAREPGLVNAMAPERAHSMAG